MSSQGVSRLSRPWLWLPSQISHDLAPYVLPIYSKIAKVKSRRWRSFEWQGLHFDNPLGIAGGVDKTGRLIQPWSQLGAGFVELGTVTPQPQGPNPGKIMDRDLKAQALWNKMGFPNSGVAVMKKKLQALGALQVPVFINIGKNRWTDNHVAAKDYGYCMKELEPFADVFVINVSSPNTKGLRDLLSDSHLEHFLSGVKAQHQEFCSSKPLLLKLSPDMEADALKSALEVSCSTVDGWILTNTTAQRPFSSGFPADSGGVSGQPLKELSLKALEVAEQVKRDHAEKLIVSVGGVSSSQDIKDRLSKGADLVQVYSSLVFEGPGFFQRRLRELSQSNECTP